MKKSDFPYGSLLPAIPSEYIPPEMWPEYGHVADPVPICRAEIVRDIPTAIRWSFWPLTFEQYVGDEIPDVGAASKGELARNRFVVWRRLQDGPTPRGWLRALPGTFRIDGYQRISDDACTSRWNKKTRRDLRQWQEHLNGGRYRIVEISQERYAEAYERSLIAEREGIFRLHDLQRKLSLPHTLAHTKLYGVEDAESGEIVAGTAIIFSPTYKSSTHFAPFILEEARHIHAATGLVHHWFTQSLAAGCPVVMTTNFWHKGKPQSWKGFSLFKSHFGFEYVAYPPSVWKFVRGKLF